MTGLYYMYVIAKNGADQWKKVFFQMTNHALFLLFSVYLYGYVYELVPRMHSLLPFPNAVWSMAMYFAVFWLGVRNIERSFRDDIRSGNIEIYLLRPMSYLWQKVYIQLGQGFIPFISASLLSVAVNLFAVGLPTIHMSALAWGVGLLAVFFLSQIVTCLIYILCGLSGFWLENSEPVYFVVSKAIMILGGAWVPVAFFPPLLQQIALYSPFGASMAISFGMYPNFAVLLPQLILICLFWITIGTLLVLFVSSRSYQRLAVNG